MDELTHSGVAELAQQLRNKKISSVELSQHFLKRAKADQHGSFLQNGFNEEVTLRQAREADALLAKGDASPLLGVPIAHKDIFVTQDFVTTAGSQMLKAYQSPFDATVVRNLGVGHGGAGMVTIGKLNCDEFAMGSSNENSAYSVVKNPWDASRIPGGSSGGSAAAVAARVVPAASGTDTGGSIRQPASFCGITGIKPTYGRASRYGIIAYASSLDQAGPMARSAQDCALLLSAMCGPDLDRDSTSLDIAREDFSKNLMTPLKSAGKKGALKIGVPRQWSMGTSAGSSAQQIDESISLHIANALQQLQHSGAQLVEIDLPHAHLAIPVYYIIASAEASSNLSRFDGVKFGHRTPSPIDLIDMYKKTRTEGFGDEVLRRIMIGTYVLSHGYYDAYYLKAQKIRRLITKDFETAFQSCDVIAGPVAPTVAWKLGHKADDPVANYLADIFTLPASLAGLPGMSIPVGLDGANMPIGMQLICNYLHESLLLNVAHQFQSFTTHHTLKAGGVV